MNFSVQRFNALKHILVSVLFVPAAFFSHSAKSSLSLFRARNTPSITYA